jgi:hypothetical protein
MVDVWFFVELDSDAVTRILSYDRISLRFYVFRDFVSDIAEVVTRAYLLDADLPCTFRHCDEFFGFRIDLSYCVHATRITEVSSDYSRDIDIEDISFFEDLISSRDTMTDHIIERYTCRPRICSRSLTPFVISEIVYTCRYSAIFQSECIHDSIEFERADSWSYILPDHIEYA